MASDARRLQELWHRQREAAERPRWTDDYTRFDWLCPFDGRAVEKVSQRTGRHYVGCPDCNSFARPGEPPPMALTTDRTATLRLLVAATAPLLGLSSREQPPRLREPDQLPF